MKRWKEACHVDARVGVDWTNNVTDFERQRIGDCRVSAGHATGSGDTATDFNPD
jgi:hypothetical protein